MKNVRNEYRAKYCKKSHQILTEPLNIRSENSIECEFIDLWNFKNN